MLGSASAWTREDRAMKQLMTAAMLLLALAARAGEGKPVKLTVGEVLKLCQAGLVMCPASSFLCDDPAVARIENGPDGVELKGIAPGTTLCSVLGRDLAFRTLLQVNVTPPEKAR
jgi:hypothetical protein